MRPFLQALSAREDRVDARRLVLLLATASVFALAVRLAVVRTDPLHSWNSRPMIVADDGYFHAAALRSLFVSLFVFEEYEGKLFDPVLPDPLLKVYRFPAGA